MKGVRNESKGDNERKLEHHVVWPFRVSLESSPFVALQVECAKKGLTFSMIISY
jgi:hypothetical protein